MDMRRTSLTPKEFEELMRAEREANREQFVSINDEDPDLAAYDARRPAAKPDIANHWAIGRRRTADDLGPHDETVSNINLSALAGTTTITHDDIMAASVRLAQLSRTPPSAPMLPRGDVSRVNDAAQQIGVSLGHLLDAMLPLMESVMDANALEFVAAPPRHGYRDITSGQRGQWWNRRAIDRNRQGR